MIVKLTQSRLDEVLLKVRERHPIRSRMSLNEVEDSLVRQVRRQLEECVWEGLSDFGAGLDSRQLMACLEIVVSERQGETVAKAVSVLNRRPRSRILYQGWRRLLIHYPHGLLEQLVRDLIQSKGYVSLASIPEVSKRVVNWLDRPLLASGILADYEANDSFENLDAYLGENQINHEHGIYRAVWRELLTQGTAQSIKKESVRRLMDEIDAVGNQAILQVICRNYLIKLERRTAWAEEILRFVERTFGMPLARNKAHEIETPFWNTVPVSVKEEFRIWRMLRRISDFFEGERAEFWRPYVEQMAVTGVREILDSEGFMLDFGCFGVVEFKRVGNAAYVYPAKVFRRFWAEAHLGTHPAYFKRREETIQRMDMPYWGGRIIHSGDWQHQTRQIIDYLLARL